MGTSFNLAVVTGSTGWLGKRMVRLLATRSFDHDAARELPTDLRVRCLAAPGEGTEELRVLGDFIEVVSGDLRNPEDCTRLVGNAHKAVLFHTAGIIHPRRVSDFYAINLEGTKNLLNAATAAGIRRAVIVSSNSPIGCNSPSIDLFDEGSPYNPYMGYGRSKMLMELAVHDFQKRGFLETVIIRPPWFYGPDQPARQTEFFSMIRRGKGPIVGSGENRRSMAFIDNLCQGLLLAALVDQAHGQTYWIADKRPYTMNEIIDTVERLLEKEFHLSVAHKRLRLPNIAATVAFWTDRMLQAAGLYNQKVHVLSEMNKTIACSVAKAERELDYRPNVELEEGMRRSISWCLERGIQI